MDLEKALLNFILFYTAKAAGPTPRPTDLAQWLTYDSSGLIPTPTPELMSNIQFTLRDGTKVDLGQPNLMGNLFWSGVALSLWQEIASDIVDPMDNAAREWRLTYPREIAALAMLSSGNIYRDRIQVDGDVVCYRGTIASGSISLTGDPQ